MSYYDRRVRARVSSKTRRTGQQGSVIKFSASATSINPKMLGMKRLWDSIAPPLIIKTSKFYPRQGNFSVPTGTYTTATVTPTLEAGVGEQRIDQFHMLSCAEWIILAAKCKDNTLLATGAEASTTPGSQASISDFDRNLMLEQYKQTFTFENCQNWGCWVEFIEVRPRRPIIDSVNTAGGTTYDNLYATTDPLGCIFKDYESNRTHFNGLFPRDSAYTLNITQAQKVLGYTVDPYGRYFNRNYLILKRKKVLIPPGGKVVYDVVIPGFKSYSDFASETVGIQAGSEYLNILPSMWEKSRTLLVRHWSDTVSGAGIQDNGLGLGDTRLKVICDKTVRIRGIPSVTRHTMVNKAIDGVDCFGAMSSTQAYQTITDANVRFIGVEDDDINIGQSV